MFQKKLSANLCQLLTIDGRQRGPSCLPSVSAAMQCCCPVCVGFSAFHITVSINIHIYAQTKLYSAKNRENEI